MKKMKGFTLLELMVVIAMIGIMSAMIVPVFQEHAAQRESLMKKEQPMNPGYGCIDQSTTVFGTSQE